MEATLHEGNIAPSRSIFCRNRVFAFASRGVYVVDFQEIVCVVEIVLNRDSGFRVQKEMIGLRSADILHGVTIIRPLVNLKIEVEDRLGNRFRRGTIFNRTERSAVADFRGIREIDFRDPCFVSVIALGT